MAVTYQRLEDGEQNGRSMAGSTKNGQDTSFGEQDRLSHGTQPNDGVCCKPTASNERALIKFDSVPKWPSVEQPMPNPVMGKNRCRVDIVGAHTNMATADDDDLASRLQFLLKTKWTIDDDKYNSDAFDQCEGAWPIAHPLPLPLWSNTIKKPFVVENVWQYEDLVGLIDVILHRLLEETHYNTVNNFVDFYKSFKGSKSPDLRAFFQSYTPPINRRHHMCVSLAMEIVTRICEVCPQLSEHMYLVSCEEAVESTQQYIMNCKHLGIDNAMYNLEKEHSLVAMRVIVADREGIMLLDPGYHVARAVTVMKDQCYPHTGWFIQSHEPHLKREYCYKFNQLNDEFVEWGERTTRGDKHDSDNSLIYIKNPYRTAIDVTVRRNLVYNFRSLLSRDAKGRVCAGIYFPVTTDGGDSAFTLFYDGSNGQSIKIKSKFNTFADEQKIPDTMMNHLENLSAQIRLSKTELCGLLKSLCDTIADRDFIKQLLAINDHITAMSADN